jgi:hypothetical protein
MRGGEGVNDEMHEYIEATGKTLNELLYSNLTRKQAIEWLTEYMQKWEMSYIIELLGEEVYEHGELEQVEGMK